MSNVLLLMCCLCAGMLLRRTGRVPDNAHLALNAVIVNLSLPAVALRALHAFKFDSSALWPVLMPWILFALGAGAFFALGKMLRLPRGAVGALTLVGGLGNTSFVGVPMIEALYGHGGVGLGLLIDQLGSYLVLSTAGVALAALYAGEQRRSWGAMARKVLGFPPFVAMVAALLLRPLAIPAEVDAALEVLGGTLAPLALLSVGIQLRLGTVREQRAALALGLGYKLVACPALVVLALWLSGLSGAHAGMEAQVGVIEAAMPPMIGAGIVAAEAGLDAQLASTLIGIGIPLGLCMAPAWRWLLMSLGQ